jgi:hypothetical protein
MISESRMLSDWIKAAQDQSIERALRNVVYLCGDNVVEHVEFRNLLHLFPESTEVSRNRREMLLRI